MAAADRIPIPIAIPISIPNRVLATANQQAAEDRSAALAATIGQIRAEGFTTVRDLTSELNARGVPTAKPGGRWHLQTVHNLLRRIDQSGRPRRR